jgi:hypothetical protein
LHHFNRLKLQQQQQPTSVSLMNKTMGNQLYKIVPLGFISSIMDLIVHADGPRIRANLSHSNQSHLNNNNNDLTTDVASYQEEENISSNDFSYCLQLAATWIGLCYHFRTSSSSSSSSASSTTTTTTPPLNEKNESERAQQLHRNLITTEAWFKEAYEMMRRYQPQFHPLARFKSQIIKTRLEIESLLTFITSHTIVLKKVCTDTTTTIRTGDDNETNDSSNTADNIKNKEKEKKKEKDKDENLNSDVVMMQLVVTFIESEGNCHHYDLFEKASKIIPPTHLMKDGKNIIKTDEEGKETNKLNKNNFKMMIPSLPCHLAQVLSTTLTSILSSIYKSSHVDNDNNNNNNNNDPASSGVIVLDDDDCSSCTASLGGHGQANDSVVIGGAWSSSRTLKLIEVAAEWESQVGVGCNHLAEVVLNDRMSVMIDPYKLGTTTGGGSGGGGNDEKKSNDLSWDSIIKELSSCGMNAAHEILLLVNEMSSTLRSSILTSELAMVVNKARERTRKNLIQSLLTMSSLAQSLKFLADLTVALCLKQQQISTKNATKGNKNVATPQQLLSKIFIAVVGLSTCILPPRTSSTTTTNNSNNNNNNSGGSGGAPSKTLAQCIPPFVEFLKSKHMTSALELIS